MFLFTKDKSNTMVYAETKKEEMEFSRAENITQLKSGKQIPSL